MMKITPSEENPGTLDPTSEYLEVFDASLKKLQDDIANMNE